LYLHPIPCCLLRIYFQNTQNNLYGDRITHVKVTQIEGPDWEITFEPEIHTATYEVTGVIQTIEENVGVELGLVVKEIPEIIPEGMDYVKHPKEEGYIPVKPVKISIEVPEDAELWRDYDFTFEAIGNCFMEPGAVIPAVATQFELSVRTISGEYHEEEITTTIPEEVTPEEERPIGITGYLVANYALIGIIIVLVILVIALTYYSFFRGGRAEEIFSYLFHSK